MKRSVTNRRVIFLSLFIAVLITLAWAEKEQFATDKWFWLEQVDGINALAWVNGQNLRTAEQYKAKPEFSSLYRQAFETLNAASRIPSVDQRGKWLYNFWQDAEHPRGIYRRTTIEEFRKANPEWQTVLDIDELSEEEKKQWVFQSMNCLEPEYRHCLVSLAPGGTDASEIREFDMEKLAFVPQGFFIPLSKSIASWKDADTLFVSLDAGGDSVTESGYPRMVKIWKRGTKRSDAQTIYTANVESVSAYAYRIFTEEGNIDLVVDSTSFWANVYFLWKDGRLQKLNLPATSVVEGGFWGKLVISLKEDWRIGESNYLEGSVIMAEPAALADGKDAPELLVAPTAEEIVGNVAPAKSAIFVKTIHNVHARLYRYVKDEGKWQRNQIPFPDNGAIDIISTDPKTGSVFVEFESFTSPPTLYYLQASDPDPEKMKAQKATFDGSQFMVEQLWATSKDGTKVPYFVVMKKDIEMNGKNPTHMFSYGGFRNSLTPSYSGSYEELHGAYGKLWLERGGVFVVANIRGGGEFGPAWHKAALRENRVRSFEDFEAITRDLFERKITSPKHLGIEGRSNGGLLVMAVITRNPQLFGAVICGSPLVDMLRYHKLPAGASWIGEYGDPEIPADRKFLASYSTYQLIERDRNYPPVFFYASTRDDRVHPGHARKAVAKMLELGYHDTYYFENTEGGHGASSTNEQLAYRLALAYTHLWQHLS